MNLIEALKICYLNNIRWNRSRRYTAPMVFLDKKASSSIRINEDSVRIEENGCGDD